MSVAKISVRLQELEQTIAQGLASFLEVANALLEIRKDRRYEERGFSNFEDYCREQWHMSLAHGKRLVAAAEVLNNLAPMGAVPTSERQIRPLTRLEVEQQREVWQEATANNHQPTATEVEKIVERKFPKPATPEQMAKLARVQSANELGSMLLALSLTPKTSRQLAQDLLDYDPETFDAYVGVKITKTAWKKAVKTLSIVARLWRSEK